MKKYRNLFLFTIITSVILLGTTVVLLYFSAKRQQNDRYITIDPDTIQLVQLEAPKDGSNMKLIRTEEQDAENDDGTISHLRGEYVLTRV